MRIKLAWLCLACSMTICAARADGEGDSGNAIRDQAKAYVEAYNRGDAHSLAAQWTENGTYTDISGNETSGRSAIEALLADLIKNRKTASNLSITVQSVKFPAPDLAIEEGEATDGSAPVHYTAVHSKVDGKWPMVSVIETPVPEAHSIDDLNWLSGTWSAKVPSSAPQSVADRLADMRMKVRSMGSNKYLQADFYSKKEGSDNISHSQIIGYDPRENLVTSWYFNGDGIGMGRWSQSAGGWVIKARNLTDNGMLSRASYRLRKVDGNTFIWSSFDRYVGRRRLPDTPVLTMVRVSE